MTQKERYTQALNNFTDQVKDDPNVIALLLFGSLAYYEVWEKSNIDLCMIVRDGASHSGGCQIDEDGINIDMSIVGVSEFKKEYQRIRGGDFFHSLAGMGAIVFTKDESIREYFEDIRKVGNDDAARSFRSRMYYGLLNMMRKTEKWITVFNDPLYAQRFLHICCVTVAEMELLTRGEVAKRESILRARELNPKLMHDLYVIPSTTAMTVEGVRHALKVIDDFLMKHIDWWSKDILRFLSGQEIKTQSQINKQCGGSPMDYLAEKGIVERVTLPSRLFKKSKLTVEECAYIYIP